MATLIPLPSGTESSDGLLASLFLANQDALYPGTGTGLGEPAGHGVDRVDLWSPGTGGSLAAYLRTNEPGTAVMSWHAVIEPTTGERTLLGSDEKIALIRSALSLNVSEVAQVLGVKRPTVYAWISGDAQPQESNRRRLDEVSEIAREWLMLTPEPLGALKRERGGDGLSVLDSLSADVIDRTQVTQLLRAAADQLGRREQAGETRQSLAEWARQRGVVLSEAPGAERDIDVLTGGRTETRWGEEG